LVSQSESILLISPLLNTSLSSGTSTTLSLSLPLPPSPSVGVVLPSPSLASPPLTGVGKGVKVSFSPFCSSPEGAGVLVVPEGGGSFGLLSAVLRCAYWFCSFVVGCSASIGRAVRLFCSRHDIRLLRAFAPGTFLCEYPNRRQGKRHRKCQCPSEKLLAFVFLCHKNPPFPVCGFRNRETICISVAGCPAANPLAV